MINKSLTITMCGSTTIEDGFSRVVDNHIPDTWYIAVFDNRCITPWEGRVSYHHGLKHGI